MSDFEAESSLAEERKGGDLCYICGQPAGGGAMENGAHVLCSWGLTDRQRREKQIVRRRGLFPSIEVLEARRAE